MTSSLEESALRKNSADDAGDDKRWSTKISLFHLRKVYTVASN